ncbi:MAG: glycosyltransferase [Myxococcota bacterium]
MSANLDLSLILACYNEEPHLAESVREIVEVLERSRLRYELIFVDDCSGDGTRRVLTEQVARLAEEQPHIPVTVLLHEKNRGRGATVRDGMRTARGRVMGFIDIDLEVHARYIPDMVRAVDNGFDVATGFRVYHVDGTNLTRHVLSVSYRALMRKAIDTHLMDTETGYKFFNRERCLPVVEQTVTDGWFWDTEIMILCERAGLTVTEIPVAFVRRLDKRSTVRVVPDTLDYLKRLVEFRLRLEGGMGPGRKPAEGTPFAAMTPPADALREGRMFSGARKTVSTPS